MKKIISIILLISLLLTLTVGCSESKESLQSTEPFNSATEAAETSPNVTEPEATSGSDSISTDENLLTVEITLPASMFDDEDMATFDFDAYVTEQGLISAEPNEDGSVTVVMTKARHKELLDELAGQMETTFAELIEGVDTPYIKAIVHNDDFSEITIKVVRADYENAIDFTAFTVGMSALVYQMFEDMEQHVEITTIDVDTGDIIDTVVWPDDMG